MTPNCRVIERKKEARWRRPSLTRWLSLLIRSYILSLKSTRLSFWHKMHEPICLFETLIAKRWRDIEAISHKYPETSDFNLKKHYPRTFDILIIIILHYTQTSAKKTLKETMLLYNEDSKFWTLSKIQLFSLHFILHLLSHDRALWIAWAEP